MAEISTQGLSLRTVEAEIVESSLDYRSLFDARDGVRKRVEAQSDIPRMLTPLQYWSGTDAVLGSLDMAISAVERTMAELKELSRKIRAGEIPNLDTGIN